MGEQMEDNHRVEKRVYLQKVKHLEYEHKHGLDSIAIEGENALAEEQASHEAREKALKIQKKDYKMDLSEREMVRAEDVNDFKARNEKSLQMMRSMFEGNTAELEARCKERLTQLEADLELRRKVHIHEIEERKNLHISDLMKNHDKAFGQMKNYYNDITNDNLKLIKDLKDEVKEMKKKQASNQMMMYTIAQENQKLKEPLTKKVAEVADLRAQLKDRDKDKLSLRNAKARLHVMESQVVGLKQDHKELLGAHVKVEKGETICTIPSRLQSKRCRTR